MSDKMPPKILLIRFSAFGDILAMMSVPVALRHRFPNAEIHWVTRADYSAMAETAKSVDHVWAVDRKMGFRELWQTTQKLRRESFTHVYDAHNNLRSHFLSWFLVGPFGLLAVLRGQKFLRRSQYRWRRFLLFRFRINKYPKPFVHQWALLEPLQAWHVSLNLPPVPVLQLPKAAHEKAQSVLGSFSPKAGFVALSPSASYALKRWPVSHWQKLIVENPHLSFALLGGAEDQFIQTIADVAPDRTLNLAGKLSYLESAAVVQHARVLVSNDTGLMHVAEQSGTLCIALLGPAPFGFPGRATTHILELNLSCRPCSKHGQGPCTNPVYQKCLQEISTSQVSQLLHRLLQDSEGQK